jgi:hypothetical protein
LYKLLEEAVVAVGPEEEEEEALAPIITLLLTQ